MKEATDYLIEAGIEYPTDEEIERINQILNDSRYPGPLADWYARETAEAYKRKREK